MFRNHQRSTNFVLRKHTIVHRLSFQVMKCATNAAEIYTDILEDQLVPTSTLVWKYNSQDTQGAMGLWWNPLKDRLTLDEKAQKNLVLTKRSMFSVLHSFYNLLGFTAPFCCVETWSISNVWLLLLISDGMHNCLMKAWQSGTISYEDWRICVN